MRYVTVVAYPDEEGINRLDEHLRKIEATVFSSLHVGAAHR